MDGLAGENAARASQIIVRGLTLTAGAVVGISGMCVVFGFLFAFGYLTTIGAPWALDLLPVSSLIQVGAPFVAVLAFSTMCALLLYGRLDRLGKLGLAILLGLGLAASVAIFLDWPPGKLLILLGAVVACGVLAPICLLRLVSAWRSRSASIELGMLVTIIAFASVLSLLLGVSSAISDRARPDVFAHLRLKGERFSGWCLVMPIGDRLLLTPAANAFHIYRVVPLDEVEELDSTRMGAPWAPE